MNGARRGAGGLWSGPGLLPILPLALGFVLQSLINSSKKEPKLLKWFPTSPHPQGRPRPQPQTPPAGRSLSGQRMPSSPCEPFCGSAPQTAGHLFPRSTLGTGRSSHPPSPLGPVLLCPHGYATVFAPRPPLVRTSFGHLVLSGWWDSVAAARGSHPPPLPLWPTGSLYPCVLPGRTGIGPSPRQGSPHGTIS